MTTIQKIIKIEIEDILKKYELENCGINIGGARKELLKLIRQATEEATKNAVKEVVSALEDHNIKVVISVIPGDDGPMIEILEAEVKKTEICE